jgi:Bacterial regulatory proteins, tetR family
MLASVTTQAVSMITFTVQDPTPRSSCIRFRGFTDTTVDDIVTKAGVAKGAF